MGAKCCSLLGRGDSGAATSHTESERLTEMARSMDGMTMDRPSMAIRPAFSDGFGYSVATGCPAQAADKARGKIVPPVNLATMQEEEDRPTGLPPTLETPETSPRQEEAPPEPEPERVIGGGTLEEDVQAWLQEVSGEEKGDMDFQEWLSDGQILCKVANKIKPGIIPKVNTGDMEDKPFKKMENITAFIKACRTLGVLENNVFSTVDLYEGKDLKSVRQCIAELGSVVRTSAPEFKGPYLGVARVAVKDKARQNQKVDMSGGFRRDVDDELKESHQMGPGGRRI